MGNAEDSVKACVDKTTLTNEEEGVAVAVERTILAEIRPTEVPLDQLNMRARHALMGNLGIQYTYASEDRVEGARRAKAMVAKMDELGFGNCTNTGACQAECPKSISIAHIARLNREFLSAKFED